MKKSESPDAPNTGGKKQKDPRKHHYVPVFYQLNFVNENGLLWVYDRVCQTYKELHPRVICFEHDLYTVKPEGKPHNMEVEVKLLGAVDSFGSRGIRDFRIGKPNSEAEQEIALLMAFQWTRGPTFSRDTRATYARMIEELSRIASANVDRARAVMESYARAKGEDLKVSPDSLVEFARSKQYEIKATETAFLSNMVEQAVSLSKELVRLDWEVLVAPEDTGFIICDCPVVVVPPKGSNDVGVLVPGAVKYFPLSKRLCMRLGDLGRHRGIRRVGKEEVRIVNQNIAANSERFIMSPSRVQLEFIVSRSGCTAMEKIPRFTTETIESDEDGSLQMLKAQPRRYFYTKSGATP